NNISLTKDDIYDDLKKYYQSFIKYADMLKRIENISIKDINLINLIDPVRVVTFIILNHKIYKSLDTIRTNVSSFQSLIMFLFDKGKIQSSFHFKYHISKKYLSFECSNLLRKIKRNRFSNEKKEKLFIDKGNLVKILDMSYNSSIEIMKRKYKFNDNEERNKTFFELQRYVLCIIILTLGGQRIQTVSMMTVKNFSFSSMYESFTFKMDSIEKKTRDNPVEIILPKFLTPIFRYFLNFRMKILNGNVINNIFFNSHLNHCKPYELTRYFSKEAKKITGLTVTSLMVRRSIPTISVDVMK